MTDSRIIYWCETHKAFGLPDVCDAVGFRGAFLECKVAPMRLIPLEVSEGMVEAAAAAMYERDPRRRSKGWDRSDSRAMWLADARAALNAALGGNDD